jgi:hypothetical protein
VQRRSWDCNKNDGLFLGLGKRRISTLRIGHGISSFL